MRVNGLKFMAWARVRCNMFDRGRRGRFRNESSDAERGVRDKNPKPKPKPKP